jgi:hypothetical protein
MVLRLKPDDTMVKATVLVTRSTTHDRRWKSRPMAIAIRRDVFLRRNAAVDDIQVWHLDDPVATHNRIFVVVLLRPWELAERLRAVGRLDSTMAVTAHLNLHKIQGIMQTWQQRSQFTASDNRRRTCRRG